MSKTYVWKAVYFRPATRSKITISMGQLDGLKNLLIFKMAKVDCPRGFKLKKIYKVQKTA
jgi:hypothetical protein